MILLLVLVLLGCVFGALSIGWPDFAVTHPYRGEDE